MIANNADDTTPLTLDPTLRRFNQQQLAVATTWANHFCVPPEELRKFIRDYLRSTSTPAVWSVTLEHEGQQIAIARFGNILQWFNGTTIRTTTCDSQLRIPKGKPGTHAAQGLANRIEALPYSTYGGLLTSFAQKAREWAVQLARKDLGKRSVLLADLEKSSPHLRYLRPKSHYYLRLIGAALREFCCALDPDLLFAVRSVQCVSPQLYNWLASGDKERRLQALRAQPILLPMLILSDHNSTFSWPYDDLGLVPPPFNCLNIHLPGPVWTGDGSGLLGQVADDGLPLVEVLAWLLQAPRASIRYLGSCRPGRAGGALFHIRVAGHEAWATMLLGADLGNRRPVTKADWQALYSLLSKIPYHVSLHQRGRTPHALQLDLNVLLKGTPTAWNDPRWQTIEGTLTDYQEFYRHLGDGERGSEIAHQYFVRKPFTQIANMVNRFHGYVEGLLKAMREELGSEEDELLTVWPALLPSGTVVSPNGVSVVELRCPADLITEHSAMKHCIDAYDYSAFHGDCRLVSFRQGGTVLASAEIRLARGVYSKTRRSDQQFYCVQLRGTRNQPVPFNSPAGRASRWFMQGLESGQISSCMEWPDQTEMLKRFAKLQWKSRVSEAVHSWISQHMGGAN